jgi:hypothetical protein
MTFTAKHISVSINRSAAQVYEFASNPENLPQWAAGLSGSIKKVNEDWIAESPMGRVKVKFAEKNKFGVLDHDATLPSGVKVYNPMRVFPNNDGSELVFYGLPPAGRVRSRVCGRCQVGRERLSELKDLT